MSQLRTFNLDSETIERLKVIAGKTGDSASSIVRKAIALYYDMVVKNKKDVHAGSTVVRIEKLVIANTCIDTELERVVNAFLYHAYKMKKMGVRDDGRNFYKVHREWIERLEKAVKGEKVDIPEYSPGLSEALSPGGVRTSTSSGHGEVEVVGGDGDFEVVAKPGGGFVDRERSVDEILSAIPRDE